MGSTRPVINPATESQPGKRPGAIARTARLLARLVAHPYFPVLALIVVNLVVGSLIVTDFGESWDERLRQRYAEQSLAAYRGEPTSLKDDKGPFYVILAQLGGQTWQRLHPDWLPIDGWHFMHFLTFQLAIFCLYDLTRRLVSRPAALGATLLFSTQPLLWGHAFINPKDIPLLAFFLATISSGLYMIRTLEGDRQPDTSRPASLARTEFYRQKLQPDLRAPSRQRLVGWGLVILILVAAALPWLARTTLQDWLAVQVTAAYQAEPGSLAGMIFNRIAQNRGDLPVELYVQKARSLYPLLATGLTLLCLAACSFFLIRLLPRSSAYLWITWLKPWLSAYLAAFTVPGVLLAGAALGLTTSIRFFGPLAGGMIALYLLARRGWRSLPALAAYASVALLVMYATWPTLWGAPWRAFTTSLSSAANFTWEGQVLFAGREYPLDGLPARYLPTLLALQLSEPTLILFLAGLGVALYRLRRGRVDRVWYAILAAWFFLPVLGFVALTPNTYDNFRHLMFILPPVFLFGGLALEALFKLAARSWLQSGLLLAVLLPNLVAIVGLHPYSYTYYNTLAGGVSGAFRQYETDYWATSYREATLYLNQAAGPGANVIVWGPDHIVEHYARPDLQIIEYRRADEAGLQGETYAVLSSRHEKDRTLYTGDPVVFQVGRGEAIFAVVKKVQ